MKPATVPNDLKTPSAAAAQTVRLLGVASVLGRACTNTGCACIGKACAWTTEKEWA